MADDIANLRTRLAQVAGLLEAAQVASKDLSGEHRAAMQALLQVAADKLTGARAVADRLERKQGR